MAFGVVAAAGGAEEAARRFQDPVGGGPAVAGELRRAPTPLSEERPAWKGLVIVPKFSRRPADWLPAIDSARAVASRSSPIRRALAAAAANVPQVAVAWKPVW